MTFRQRLYIIIFGTETKGGRLFDLVLLWTILLSVLTVMVESIKSFEVQYAHIFNILEWTFTILFSLEYGARIFSHYKPRKYILSFWGLIDLFSILPTYLSLFFTGVHFLLVIRILRLLRVFRILKLGRYFTESQSLVKALRNSSYKITVFFISVILIVIIMGSIMYVVENGENGFESIPKSIYWAVITLTTVGYGDIVPVTVLGKLISSVIMIIGYSIIAVPTGILSVEISRSTNKKQQVCPDCNTNITNPEAEYCHKCGTKLKKEKDLTL